jgi:hypothetical protein
VLDLWKRFEAVCTYEIPSKLAEFNQMFASFKPAMSGVAAIAAVVERGILGQHPVFEILRQHRGHLCIESEHDGEIGAVRGSRDDDPLGAGLEVLCRRLALGKDAGAFERDIDPQFLPR